MLNYIKRCPVLYAHITETISEVCEQKLSPYLRLLVFCGSSSRLQSVITICGWYVLYIEKESTYEVCIEENYCLCSVAIPHCAVG